MSKHWQKPVTYNICKTHIQQAGWFLQPDCAPSSECPRASIAAHRRATSSIRISRRALRCCSSAIAGIAIGENFKTYLLHQSCSNQVQIFFTIHRRHRRKKRWTRILKFEFCDFLKNFFKFAKRCCAVPLQPIWTIMVAAKLDHSRVLVTKFSQNRPTVKGRSASQRHTQTDKLG